MAELPKSSPELHGWKEIASYLRISVRTAQTLENEKGLPIHRGIGVKAPVRAIPAELDAWRATAGTLPPKKAETCVSVDDIGARSRRLWLRYAVGSGAAVLAGACGAIMAPKVWTWSHQPPSAYRVEGATLIVTGKNGVELWRHTFPEQLTESSSINEPGLCLFVDVTGDGRVSTLFNVPPTRGPSSSKLIRFSAEGRPCWTYIPGRAVTDNRGRQFVPPYCPSCFKVIHSKTHRGTRVVVSSVHNWSFPSQVAALDGPTGNLLSEYWHRGHLRPFVVEDIDGDGEPEVVLGGVNDAPEYKQATLVVLDSNRILGSSKDPSGVPYFRGIAPAAEKRLVFFPRTPIGKSREFNQVVDIRLAAGRITVVVDETPGDPGGILIYEFDYSLRPVGVSLSTTIMTLFNEMQASGKLPKESPYVIADRLMSQIKIVDG